jgi:LysM repeat protein
MRKDFQLLTLFMLTVFFSSVSFAKGRAVTCDEYYSGKSLERKASRFKKAINHAAKKHGVNRDFIKAVIAVETCFRPNARGSLGEKGLMQLMPATARKMGVKNGYNSWQNVDGGTRYLKYLLRRFNGNKRYAAAAYNGGPGAVSRTKGPRFPQVRKYSRHVMRAYHKMNGVKDFSSKKSQRNKKIKTYRVRKGQTLSTVARITNISVKRLKAINKLSSSHLKVGQRLRLSAISTNKAKIKTNTNTGSKSKIAKAARKATFVRSSRSRKKLYRVRLNQTLYSIARESGVSVQRLKQLNKLRSSTIKVGQRLRLR